MLTYSLKLIAVLNNDCIFNNDYDEQWVTFFLTTIVFLTMIYYFRQLCVEQSLQV